MDYFDILLAKKLSGGGGGDITVEGLNVEENGTYTAPSGKAYSPVVVNLPLDEKTITANGEYLASADDLKGFSKVTVNVAGFTKKAMPTGAISSFNDGTANPLTKLKIAINPVQAGSGDPSPSNPRPISGWTGAVIVNNGSINVWDEKWEQGYYDTSSGLPKNGSYFRSKYNIYIKPDTQYKFVNLGSGAARVLYYDKDDNYISYTVINSPPQNFRTPVNANYIRFYMTSEYGDGTSYGNNISINSLITDSSYYPYVGSTVPISWQTEAGTVYGGELDVTSGVLKVNKIGVKVKDLSWTYQSSGLRFFTSDLASVIKTPADNTQALEGFICETLKTLSANQVFVSEGCIGVASSGNIFLRNTAWDEEQEVISAIGDNYIVYPIITPQTYQLTPTQVSSILGTNNIWADTGNILEGEYFTSL